MTSLANMTVAAILEACFSEDLPATELDGVAPDRPSTFLGGVIVSAVVSVVAFADLVGAGTE